MANVEEVAAVAGQLTEPSGNRLQMASELGMSKKATARSLQPITALLNVSRPHHQPLELQMRRLKLLLPTASDSLSQTQWHLFSLLSYTYLRSCICGKMSLLCLTPIPVQLLPPTDTLPLLVSC